MLGRLMPREGKFFDLFNAHAERIVEGSRELAAMIGTFTELEAHAQRIDAAERAADKITHETIALLHKTFITPFDRDQIHQLITTMDDILDLIQDVAESMALYDLRTITPEAKQLAEICQMCCERVKTAVGAAHQRQAARGDPQDLRGDRPPGVRRRPRDARGDVEAVPRGARRQAADQAAHRSTSCSSRSPTAARTWPTSSKASSSRTPEGMETLVQISLGVVIALVLVALAFDFMNGFHDAANSIATVVSTRVLKPYQAVLHGGVLQLRRAVRVPPQRRHHHRPRHHRPGHRRPLRGVRRAGRRHRLEPDHLVVRHPVLVLARADRRPGAARRSPRPAPGR